MARPSTVAVGTPLRAGVTVRMPPAACRTADASDGARDARAARLASNVFMRLCLHILGAVKTSPDFLTCSIRTTDHARLKITSSPAIYMAFPQCPSISYVTPTLQDQ